MDPIIILFIIQFTIICAILLNHSYKKDVATGDKAVAKIQQYLRAFTQMFKSHREFIESLDKPGPCSNRRRNKRESIFIGKADPKRQKKRTCKNYDRGKFKRKKTHQQQSYQASQLTDQSHFKQTQSCASNINLSLIPSFDFIKKISTFWKNLMRKERAVERDRKTINLDGKFEEVTKLQKGKLISSGYLQKLIMMRKTEAVLKRKIARVNVLIQRNRNVMPLDAIPEVVSSQGC